MEIVQVFDWNLVIVGLESVKMVAAFNGNRSFSSG